MELAPAIGFSAELLMPILDAFAGLKVKGKRRKGQTYHPQFLNFFVQDDWTKMGAEDATAYTILEVIIQRAYLLGGINLSEQCTNFLTSLMIEVTGARNMSIRERKGWHTYLKAELKKLVRDREPLEYIVVLPAT